MSISIFFKSFGCRTNQEELYSIQNYLCLKGYKSVTSPEKADFVIINSCCVTASAESKIFRYITALRRSNPQIKIIVTGCFAQHSPQKLSGYGVWGVAGNSMKDCIDEIIKKGKEGIFHEPLEQLTNLMNGPLYTLVDPAASPRTRFALKIQEGCDCRCSYCIVPFVRGKSRSADSELLLKIFSSAIKLGYKEIVITGTNIGKYFDCRGISLIGLLDKMVRLEGDFRIRLSSIESSDINQKLLDFILSTDKICRHLHVSIQSFSTPVLKAMNRPFSRVDSLIDLLHAFRKNNPLFGLGADFIVGFPGETEEMFSETLGAVRHIGFSYGHVFRFSPRPSTAAAAMDKQVAETEKTIRSLRLRKALHQMQANFIQGMKDKTFSIIVENTSPVTGITSNYIRCIVKNCSALRNSWLNVKIIDSINGTKEVEAIKE